MKSYSIVWTSRSVSELVVSVEFIANVSLEAAQKLRDDLYNSISSLSTLPERNQVFDMPKGFSKTIRKLVVNKRYIVLYAIEDSSIVIYSFQDTRRKFTRLI